MNNKLTNCKACGKELAKGVKKCTSCGKDQRNFFMKHKILTGVLILAIIGAITSDGGNSNAVKESNNLQPQKSTYELKHGELLDRTISGDTLVIKAKIEPSYKNSATINQNGFNVEDIVKNQDGDKYKKIQYWAVADMSNGSESKVISFTLNEDLIKSIKNGNTVGNQIVDKAQDVWILPSLQE